VAVRLQPYKIRFFSLENITLYVYRIALTLPATSSGSLYGAKDGGKHEQGGGAVVLRESGL
jgi:hypothetical protein